MTILVDDLVRAAREFSVAQDPNEELTSGEACEAFDIHWAALELIKQFFEDSSDGFTAEEAYRDGFVAGVLAARIEARR